MNFPRIDLIKHSSHSASHKKKLSYLKSMIKSNNRKQVRNTGTKFEKTIFELNFNYGNSDAKLKLTRDSRFTTYGFSSIRSSSNSKKSRERILKNLKKKQKRENKYADIIPKSSDLILSISRKLKNKEYQTRSKSSPIGRAKVSIGDVSRRKKPTQQKNEKNLSLSKKFDEFMNQKFQRYQQNTKKTKSFFIRKKMKKRHPLFKSVKLNKRKRCKRAQINNKSVIDNFM